MKQYLDLLKDILENGQQKGDRTGTGTLSVFGRQLRFDLSKGFPLLTTKKLNFKGIVYELLWFLRGDTNIKYLNDNGVHIWDSWSYPNGEVGPSYARQWRAWSNGTGGVIDQIERVVTEIQRNPDSRRLIVSAWNVADIDKIKLPPCHCLFQFYVINNKLSCHMYQRSCDFFLGEPWNIASYSLLTMMVAKVCNLQAGELVQSISDVHLYNNHIEQAKLQISREPADLPTLEIKFSPLTVNNIFGFDYRDFVLRNYNPYPAIKAPISV